MSTCGRAEPEGLQLGRPQVGNYTVCFWGDEAMEGSSGASGYVDECWKDQPLGEGTPVVVTSGAVTAGINVVLSRKTT